MQTRQRVRSTIGLALVAAIVAAVSSVSVSRAAASDTRVAIDVTSVLQRTDAHALGVGSSTYGANPLTSPAQAAAEEALDARYVRLPVGYRNGTVTTSAGGTNGGVDIPALVAQYRAWGYRVLVVCGGRTNDVDIQPGDATKIMQALGFDGIDYTTPNEPTVSGKNVQDSIRWAQMISDEGRALDPGFKVWGPVWSHYDREAMQTFTDALGDRMAALDYHHYAMGSESLSTAEAMQRTSVYGDEVRALRSDLAARGLPEVVNVDELNFSWRYQDGTPGGNNRFFTATNTVWMASAIGHTLQAGGRAMPYATQNGPLGVMVEKGNSNPDNRPASSPMPAYWGIGAWTGASVWPHYKDAFYATTTQGSDAVESFAVNNEADGYNFVVLNKGESARQRVLATAAGLGGRAYRVYQSDPAKPYDQPAVVKSGLLSDAGGLDLDLPAMSLAIVVVDGEGGGNAPAPAPAPAPAVDTLRLTSARSMPSVVNMTWPMSSNEQGITGYRVSRNGTDSDGGGGHSAMLPATATTFSFTLLLPGTAYTFSVQPLTDSGPLPARSKTVRTLPLP